jgi:antitoxin ParD1/3/4
MIAIQATLANMNVSLTPALEKLVQKRVASGRYGSASEVVREALRLLEQRDRLEQARLRDLRAALDLGISQLDRGEGMALDDKTVKRIKARGRRRLKTHGAKP